MVAAAERGPEARLGVQILRVDSARRMIYGVAAAEVPDNAGEVMDYAASKPYIEAWSREILRLSGGESQGNVRAMHPYEDPRTGHTIFQNEAVGRVTSLRFNDKRKWVMVTIEVVADWAWALVEKRVLIGLSMGGHCVGAKVVRKDGYAWYVLLPNEVSLVDNPMIPVCSIVILKGDGTRAVVRPKTNGGKAMDENEVKAIVDQVGAAMGEKIQKVFGDTVKKQDDRMAALEAGLETVTGLLGELVTPPKGKATVVQKADDTATAAAAAIAAAVAAKDEAGATVGDGSGEIGAPIKKGDLDRMIHESLEKPETPWFFRGVTA